jgi:hypothetical protein
MTSLSTGDPFGLRDQSLDEAIVVEGRAGTWRPDGRESRDWRRLVAWSPRSVPVSLLLVAGIGLGPRGINLLSVNVLSLLDPVVPVALAALGVLVGLAGSDRRMGNWRLLTAAGLESATTMLVVSAGIGIVARVAMSSDARSFGTLVLASGICAATSLTLPAGNPLEPRTTTGTLVREFGVLLPIVAGGFVLAWLHAGSPLGAIVLMAQGCGVTLALAAAAWLLLTRTSSATEERVLGVSALLLVGGVADALALSALFGGLVAGECWRYAGRHPRETIGRDVLFVQHPLLVLVLLVAGARADLSLASLALGAGYVVLRSVGKLAGGLVARRTVDLRVPRDLGLHLLQPGVFGVAFALNVVSVVGADAGLVLAAVVAGTVGSELVAILLPPQSVAE